MVRLIMPLKKSANGIGHRSRFLWIISAAIIVLVSLIWLSFALTPASASKEGLQFSAQGDVTCVVPVPYTTSGSYCPPDGSQVLGFVMNAAYPNGHGNVLYASFSSEMIGLTVVETYHISHVIVTSTDATLQGVVATASCSPSPCALPFPGIVGSAVSVSFGYQMQSDGSATFTFLTATVAGSHTTIAATATGSISAQSESN
jgi:hypothetical protein